MQNFHWNLLLLAIWIGFSPEYERLQSKQRENLSSENAVRKIVHERTKITGWHPSYCLSNFRMKQEAKAPNEFWGGTNIKRVPDTGSLGCWTAWPLEWDCAGPQSLWSLGWRLSRIHKHLKKSKCRRLKGRKEILTLRRWSSRWQQPHLAETENRDVAQKS